MNKFQQLEQEGRKLFQEILDQRNITTGQPSKNLYDVYDYSYTNKGKNIGVEIKKRDLRYLNYPTHFMEVTKFNSLMKLIKEGQFDGIVYANFFGETVAYLYSVQTIAKGIREGKIKVSTVPCNKTTAIDNGKVDKQIIELPLEYGIRCEKMAGEWIFNIKPSNN